MTSSENMDSENLVKLALASRGLGDFFDEACDSADDWLAQVKAILGGG